MTEHDNTFGYSFSKPLITKKNLKKWGSEFETDNVDIRKAKTKCQHTKKAYMKAFYKELTKKSFKDVDA